MMCPHREKKSQEDDDEWMCDDLTLMWLITWPFLFGSVSFVIDESNLKGGSSRQKFWLGGAAPQTPQFLAGAAKLPQTPPLNGHSSHLIEAAKRGRLDQMIFFSAPLTTRAPPTTVPTTVRRPAEPICAG